MKNTFTPKCEIIKNNWITSSLSFKNLYIYICILSKCIQYFYKQHKQYMNIFIMLWETFFSNLFMKVSQIPFKESRKSLRIGQSCQRKITTKTSSFFNKLFFPLFCFENVFIFFFRLIHDIFFSWLSLFIHNRNV